MVFHKDKTGADIHTPYFATYANAAARTGATGLTAADVLKTALQLDNFSEWLLTDDSPLTWQQVGGTGVTGTFTTEEGDVVETAATGTIDFDDSDFNVSVSPAGEANVALNYGAGVGQPAEGNHAHAGVVTGFTIALGDGTNVITSSEPPQIVRMPVAVTVTGWELDGDASGTITLEVDRAASGSPGTFASVAGSEKPALAGPAQFASDASPFSGGDTTWDAGDRIRVSVSGTPTVVKRVYFHVALTRSL